MSFFGRKPEQPQSSVQSEFVEDAAPSAPQVTSAASHLSVSVYTLPGAYLHPITKDNGIEYLFINENPMGAPSATPKERLTGSFGPLPMRTNYDKMLYGTGAAYFSGFIGGGIYGAYRGLQIAQGNSFKIRYNSVLNSIGRQGPRISNSMGVLTLGWALLDNTFYSFRDTSDYYNHLSAAFLSGALFKSTGTVFDSLFEFQLNLVFYLLRTAGVRPALIAGGLMTSVVGAYGLWENFASSDTKAKVPSIAPSPAPAA
ncbi:UNVERIFIED_CONTAM: Mitochondrial import inner membrane translocase subunit tim23 [Siphonaria sp. JEL0065]|nr:Mitochondrial import inner membrane translocase subunit tim23 [Siphonaria sp. JEL0065]